jgi:hypothetical protein
MALVAVRRGRAVAEPAGRALIGAGEMDVGALAERQYTPLTSKLSVRRFRLPELPTATGWPSLDRPLEPSIWECVRTQSVWRFFCLSL